MNQTQEKLRELLELINLNQKELAKQIGVAESLIYAAESSKSILSDEFIFKLSFHYPLLNLEWLLKGVGNPFVPGQLVDEEPPFELSIPRIDHLEEEELFSAAMNKFLSLNYQPSKKEAALVARNGFYLYQYHNHQYFLVHKCGDVESLFQEHASKCLWLAPKPLLRYYLNPEVCDVILDTKSFYDRSEYLYLSVLSSVFSPGIMALNHHIEQNIQNPDSLREQIVKYLDLNYVIPSYENIYDVNVVTIDGQAFRVCEVSALI